MKRNLILLVVVRLYAFTTHGQVPESDSLALVSLYNSTNGDSWTEHTNWLQPGQPVSTWYGITVYNDSVEQIRLYENNLTGTLPDEIGDFTNLKVLDLNTNQISGTIPVSIGNLTQLTTLSFKDNQLIGNIPVEIGYLINLEFLYLFENQLEDSIPAAIGNLVNLQYLLLSNNQLTGPIPKEICNLTNLYKLSLSYNQLTDSIPVNIGELTELRTLDLDHNNLTGSIPSNIGNLTNLTALNLTSDQLIGHIPVEVGNLTGLTWLSLEQNQLSGPIPTEIGNLTELNYLSLASNDLTGPVPTEIGNLTKLLNLFLSSNHLDGNIPAEIGNLRELTYLCLGNNELCGAIPHEIGNLDSLQELALEFNELTNSIPSEIGNLKKLTYLWLRGNQLSDSIPDEICSLDKLQYVFLSHNNLGDRIPDGIKDMPVLAGLQIDYNYFNFYDLEPLAGLSIGSFVYYPQGFVALNTTQINSSTGNDLDIDITDLALSECSTINNQYQWWKDGISITAGSDSPILSLIGLDISDEGQYYCTMYNSDFPLLLLTTDTFSLVVDGPVDIILSPDSVDENSPSGTMVGLLSAEDPDQSEGHIFTFIEGDGINDSDNGLFSISSDTLFINTSPDYETQPEYSIYVRATDTDSKTYDKALVVYVNDVQESEPTAIAIHNQRENSVRVYPNPISDHIVLEYKATKTETLSVELFDLQGYSIQSFISYKIFQPGTHQIDLLLNEKIPSGMYMLIISNQSGKQCTPVIKF
jgi:Leucine-rich repeat (LRR) protein